MARIGGRKEGGARVGLVTAEEGFERRERGVEPWRKGVATEDGEESLRECNGGSWRSEPVIDISSLVMKFGFHEEEDKRMRSCAFWIGYFG